MMKKIAISNIAWNKGEDKIVLTLLKKYAIGGVEIAPTKIWESPTTQSAAEIKKYRKFWESEGITIPSTQALLFGHPELMLFEDKSTRNKTLLYLEKMIEVSALLGAKALVFGSPKNRNRRTIDTKKALEIAKEFFYKIGERAKEYDTFFCIEPNPKEYGTNFINTTKEALRLIKVVDHPHFRLHLDSGALTVNKEEYLSSLTSGFNYMQHFHISERDLLPLGTTGVDHQAIAKILKDLQYKGWVSIEMRELAGVANSKTVEKALKFASDIYVL